tara:strand:- start:1956 stop:3404 length:1449 start_codon:yes stop_codon:yes gene_type:complete
MIPTRVVSDWAEENVDYAGLTTLSLDANGVFVSSDQNTNSELATIPNYFAFGDWTASVVNNSISFSLWFKWDGGVTPPTSPLTLLESSWTAGFPFEIVISNQQSVLTNNSSNTTPIGAQVTALLSDLSIDVIDGGWHHIVVTRSYLQTRFIPIGTHDYVVVDGQFESSYVATDNRAAARQTRETNSNFEDFVLGSDGNAFSIDSVEINNGVSLTFKQAKWLFDQGRGNGRIANAVAQQTTDLYAVGASRIVHTSLLNSPLIDVSGLSIDADGNYTVPSSGLDIKDVNFRWDTTQGWPGKAYSFWAKCNTPSNSNKTLFQLHYGLGTFMANNQATFGWRLHTNTGTLNPKLSTTIIAARERDGSTNSWAGFRQIFPGANDLYYGDEHTVLDGNMKHFIISIVKNADKSVTMKTYVNGILVNAKTAGTNSTYCIRNGLVGEFTVDPIMTMNGDVEVLLGEFDDTEATSIFNAAKVSNPYAANLI